MPASRPSEGTGPVPSASSNAADFLFSRRQLPFPGSQKPLSAPQPPPILTKPRRSSALHYDCIRQDHHRRCPAFFQPEPSTEPAPCARSCLFQKAHPPHKSTFPHHLYPIAGNFPLPGAPTIHKDQSRTAPTIRPALQSSIQTSLLTCRFFQAPEPSPQPRATTLRNPLLAPGAAFF